MRRYALYGLTAVLALSVSACGGGSTAAQPAGSGSGSAAASARSGFPVEIADCSGRQTTIAAPPKKIVTSNAAGLEMLFWLGAGNRVIGTGFPPGSGTMPAQFAQQAAKVPVLGRQVIAKEKLLGSGADLYVDTFARMAGMGAMGDAPSEQEFSAAGITHMYLLSTACAAMAKGPMTDLSAVEEDIRRLGAVTGTSVRAGELVDGMEKKVGAVRTALAGVPADKRPTYFFFDADAGTQAPTAACSKQVANAIITLAGARNVFADCPVDFKKVGWEDVVAKNPDWIQLGVRNHGSPQANEQAFDAAEKFLRSNPATSGLKAVKEGHFLRIGSEQTTIAGVRDADTVQQIAHTLYPALVQAGR